MSWSESSFADVFRFRNGKAIKPKSAGEFPAYGSNGKIGHSPNWTYENAVILGRVGAYCGSVEYCKGRFWASDNTIVVEPLPDQMDIAFSYYFLKHANLNRHAGGAAQPLLTQGTLKSLVGRFPTISVQKKIAHILSAYDDLIENNRQRINILEDTVHGLFEEWFEKRGGDHVKVPLGHLGMVHRGRSYRKQDIEGDGGLPFVSLKCLLRDGGFRADGIKSYNGPFKDTQRVFNGDIIMAVTDMTQERRIVAHSARVANIKAPFGVISMDVVKIEAREGVPREFLYALLRWSGFADVVKQHANGANVLHLSPSLIEQALVKKPTQKQMTDFAEIVGPMFGLTDALAQSILTLRTTRDVLLPKLLSGEIEVSAAKDALEAAAA